MITEEIIKIGEKDFIKHFSDLYYIIQDLTGILYLEAIDVIPCKYTYTESDKELPIVPSIEEAIIEELSSNEEDLAEKEL